MKGSEILVNSLVEHNVEYVFGLPGDTSLDWYESLYNARKKITHVLTTDERNAVYMADAYARLTGRPGVCEGPSGGGATYMVPGVYEAHQSSIPLLALNTDIPVTSRGKAVLTELDQVHLFKEATKWSTRVDQVDKIPGAVKKAFKEATTGRPGAVHLAFPMDILASTTDTDFKQEIDPKFLRVPSERFSPPEDHLKKALKIILDAERPVIIAGGGIHLSRAYKALERFAVAIGSPVGTSITGKGSIDERHPLSVGVVGENGGNDHSNSMVLESDLIIFVGTQTGSVVTCHWHIPPDDGTRKIIQVDINPEEIGRNYTVDCGLTGDARAVLEGLLYMLEKDLKKKDTKRISRIEKNIKMWKEQELEKVDNTSARPIHPLKIVKTCQKILPDCIYLVDPGTPTPYFSSYCTVKAGRSFIVPRAYGALGYAIPAAVGAHMADTSRKIVSLTGDGSMLVSMAELATIARESVPVTVILFHNNEYSWVKTNMKNRKGEKYLSLDFQDIQYYRVAESLGVTSYTAETAGEFEDSLKKAVALDGPTFIDAQTLPLHEISSGFPWRKY